MTNLKKLAEEIISRVSKKTSDLQNKAVDEHGLFMAPLIDSTEMIIEEIISLCERVQKESLVTRIEFPSHYNVTKAGDNFFKTRNFTEVTEEAIVRLTWFYANEWLRDNIRVAPVKQVNEPTINTTINPAINMQQMSDTKLQQLAQDFYQWGLDEHFDYREEIKKAFIAGYRAAEKKARE